MNPNEKSPAYPCFVAAEAFWKQNETPTWMNGIPWFMEFYQAALFRETKLFDRIAKIKAKFVADKDFADGFCTDGKATFFDYLEKRPDDWCEMEKTKINFGGDREWNVIQMDTQSLRFWILFKIGDREKGEADQVHIRVVEWKGKGFPKFDYKKHYCYKDGRDAGFVASVRKDYKEEYESKDSFLGWQKFCWWHNYFESLECAAEETA